MPQPRRPRRLATIAAAVALPVLAVAPATTGRSRQSAKGLSKLQAITVSREKTADYLQAHFGARVLLPDIASSCKRARGSGTPWKCEVSAPSVLGECKGTLVVFGSPPDHVKARDINIACGQ